MDLKATPGDMHTKANTNVHVNSSFGLQPLWVPIIQLFCLQRKQIVSCFLEIKTATMTNTQLDFVVTKT